MVTSMPSLILPGAAKHLLMDTAPCDPNLPAKAIAHITADRNATKAKPMEHVSFEKLVGWFTGGGAPVAPHILWDPFTGQFAQFYTPQSRSKSLVDGPDPLRTNRAGKVVIQIEAVFFPWTLYGGKTYATLKDTPCKNWGILNSWIKAWGVPNSWPGGVPTKLARDDYAAYGNHGGWFGHNQVPDGNTHVDPGSWPDFVGVAREAPAFPGKKYFHVGVPSSHTLDVTKQLIRLKYNKNHDGTSFKPGTMYTKYVQANVRDFQHSRGWTGADADGLVGPETWRLLHVL
jgi:hypothetical protein